MRRNHDFMIEIRVNTIVVTGDFDLLSLEDLEWAIRALSRRPIEVDLAGVEQIAWPGLRMLLDARIRHPHLRVVAVSEQVDRVLVSSGTSEYLRGPSDAFGIRETARDAVSNVKEQAADSVSDKDQG